MDLRQLPALNAIRAFEAAARHENFSRAADELFVTHGAVSLRYAHSRKNSACSCSRATASGCA